MKIHTHEGRPEVLKELDISDTDLRSLIPTFGQRQQKLDHQWKDALARAGLSSVSQELRFGDLSSQADIANLIELSPFMRLGRLSVEKQCKAGKLAEVDSYLEAEEVPALLHFREDSAVLVFSEIDPRRVLRLMQKQVIQLICNLDPTVASCTGIDLQNYGANFALLMAAIPSFKAITDSRDLDDLFRGIPEILKERNKTKGYAHDYIYGYNKAHKDSTVPYQFIFISNYDSDLNDDQKLVIDRLMNNENAAKAGIYFIINFGKRDEFQRFSEKYTKLPQVVESGDSSKNAKLEICNKTGLDTTDRGVHQVFEVIQDKEDVRLITDLTDFCSAHLRAPRPEPVILDLPGETEWMTKAWTETSELGIKVPMGKSKGQQIDFVLGGKSGIVHNALIGGAVGTGKTNLLHSIILQTLALYSPEEIALSIMDYKSGTEFGTYKSVPHLYAISLGGGTKFGVDLLIHFQDELERRAELFKEQNVSNLASYRAKTGIKIPRHLVVIDEFQVLFTKSEQAKSSLEDLIRRGRSFGFNFILSTQSLKDSSLSSPTKTNIGARICLRLSEADCSDFLSIENTLPSRFTFAGQAVYNDREGRPEANVELRVAYYSDDSIAKFFRLIAVKAEIAGFELQAPYIYAEDSVLLKIQMSIVRPINSLFLGYQEGIPRVQKFVSLDVSGGAILVLGVGRMKEAFEDHFRDELKFINSEDYLELVHSDVEEYLSKVESFEVTPPKVLILRLKGKEANSPTVQNAITNLLQQSTSKLILFMDSKAILRQIYCLDERSAALVVYLDQKSVDGYGDELKGSTGSVAAMLQDESELSIIKIPNIVKEK